MILKTMKWSRVLAGWTALVLAGCGNGHHREQIPPGLPPADATFEKVAEHERPVTEDVVGTVRAINRATVEAKVSGRLSSVNVDLGDTVKAGETIAVVDAQEVRARLDRAVANRDQAARDWKRAAMLLDRQVTSRQEYDNAESKYRAAEAAFNEARAMLDYVEILAPFDGVIARRLADPGDFAAPGKPIVEVESPDTLRFEADVPEAMISFVNSGEEIEVTIPSIRRTITGTVAEIAPTADSGSRTFPVRINLPAVGGLRAGQFGRAAVPVGKKVSVRVPLAALVVRGQMEMVFVRDGDQVSMRLVRTGKTLGDEIEVLSGLRPGDEVAVSGASNLVDGQPLAAAQ
jgi:membrane fusion protein, multidrug efflux system